MGRWHAFKAGLPAPCYEEDASTSTICLLTHVHRDSTLLITMAPAIKKTRGLTLRGKTWYYNVTENGREVRRSTGMTSKAAALMELGKLKSLRDEGKSILDRKRPDKVLTFGALCDQWYEVHLSQKRMNGSIEMIKIWKRGIGVNTVLKSITSATIKQFLMTMRFTASPSGEALVTVAGTDT